MQPLNNPKGILENHKRKISQTLCMYKFNIYIFRIVVIFDFKKCHFAQTVQKIYDKS